MYDTLGPVGIVGVLAFLGGIVLIGVVANAPVIAGGVLLALVGFVLVLKGIVDSVMEAMGMKGAL